MPKQIVYEELKYGHSSRLSLDDNDKESLIKVVHSAVTTNETLQTFCII